jgi:RNA 2',3'-cyclic 3'-phosphodiesterase
MRIFIGIDLDDKVRGRIERFIEGVQGFAPEARWARPESLHVTLKFIGEQAGEQVEAIAERLRRVESSAFEMRCEGYGFFPTANAARVFWIGIQPVPQLAELAGRIDEAVAEVGVPREERPFSPHLTLARAGGRSGSLRRLTNNTFAVLEKRLKAMRELEFSTMKVRKFILYRSQTSPGGSKYTKLENFLLSRS